MLGGANGLVLEMSEGLGNHRVRGVLRYTL